MMLFATSTAEIQTFTIDSKICFMLLMNYNHNSFPVIAVGRMISCSCSESTA